MQIFIKKIRGQQVRCLYEVWEVYGDHKGSFIYSLGSVLGPYGVIRGRLYEVWEVYGDPRGSTGRLYEVNIYHDNNITFISQNLWTDFCSQAWGRLNSYRPIPKYSSRIDARDIKKKRNFIEL